MNKIVIIIFALLLLPYVGLPSSYDVWIVLMLVAALLFFLFKIVRERRKGIATPGAIKPSETEKETPQKRKSITQKITKKETLLSKDDKDSIKKAVQDSQ